MEALITAALIALAAIINFWGSRKIQKRIDYEFTNNGGMSARDVMDRNEAAAKMNSATMDFVVVKMGRIEDKVDDIGAKAEEAKQVAEYARLRAEEVRALVVIADDRGHDERTDISNQIDDLPL